MAKIAAVQDVKQDSSNSVRISLFSRGSDIVTLKLFNRIMCDPKKLWHTKDFHDIASDIVVRRKLKDLVNKGVVVRLKTYPAFYKLKSNG
jgi:hypothetical protein